MGIATRGKRPTCTNAAPRGLLLGPLPVFESGPAPGSDPTGAPGSHKRAEVDSLLIRREKFIVGFPGHIAPLYVSHESWRGRDPEPRLPRASARPVCAGVSAYEAARPLPGGGSVAGIPPSVTCSVHADPDQYRCSCRPVGSTSQPGAIPVKVTLPDDASAASGGRPWDVASVNELVGAGAPAGGPCRPCWRRRAGSIRITKNAMKTTTKSQEPWP